MQANTKNIALIFLAASTLGLGVQLLHTRQQLADARKAPSLQVKRSDITVSAAPNPIVSRDTLEATPTVDSVIENESASEGAPGGPANFAGRGGRGGFGQQMAELMNDPEFASAMKIEQEARIEQRYGALFKQLNLSPDQIATLKALLVDRENANREVMAISREQGLNPRANRDELRQLTAEFQAEVDANIKATLGEKVLNELVAYNSSGPQRSTVDDLNRKLAYSSQPLTDAQSRMLTSILAETGRTSGRSAIITDATIARAQGVLAPAQIAELKKLQAEQQARQLMQAKMREARERAQAARNAARQNNN
jgi:hypothetical protein